MSKSSREYLERQEEVLRIFNSDDPEYTDKIKIHSELIGEDKMISFSVYNRQTVNTRICNEKTGTCISFTESELIELQDAIEFSFWDVEERKNGLEK